MPGIFISYRRSDNPDATGRIYDRLVAEFGKARVFKDVDSIPLGQDFRGHLNDIVGGCAVVLAIIGPKWVDIRNEAGQKRLDDPDDFVRIELEAALARDVPVVPVLVGHAPMPGTSQLPSTLASLAFRQSIEVRPDPDFHNDATRLVMALRQMIDPGAPPEKATAIHAAPTRRSGFPWLAGLAAATTLAAVAFAIPALRHLRETPPPETRIAITVPVGDDVFAFALSPDGRQIVYQGNGDSDTRLRLRSLSTMTAEPLPGTEGGGFPFWSPDGRSIGFVAAGSLKRLDLGGGQPQILASLNVGNSAPVGVWSANGDILFSSGPGQSVVRIASTGGTFAEVSRTGPKDNGQGPQVVLPDGQHFLFVVPPSEKTAGIYLGSLDGSPPVRLTTDVSPVAYLPSGWMLWVRGGDGVLANFSGALVAQRLDVRNARLIGAPVSVAGEVRAFSVSASGLVAYRTLSPAAGLRQLTWVDRSGKELGTVGDADATLIAPRVAPDGRRVVVSRMVQSNRDLWLLDGARSSRMTFDAAEDNWPAWSPDGLRITFASNRSGSFVLYEKLATGAGGEERIQIPNNVAYPSGWSADGRTLVYFGFENGSEVGIWVLPQSGDRKAYPFLKSPFLAIWGQVSPDGRWMAYQSDESGRNQVFVRPFHPPGATDGRNDPKATAVQWMVSTEGGISPLWSADGKEIYFIDPSGAMMAAPITVAGAALVPGIPVKLFDSQILGGGADQGRQYDVARGGRFLINRVRKAEATPTITLLQNWNPEANAR